MKKKILLISLSLILLISLLTSCKSKDPKELLRDAYLNNLSINTSKQYTELGIVLNAESEDPIQQSIINAVNGSKLKIEMESDKNSNKFKGDITLELKGFGTSFNGEIYGDSDLILLKIPMFPQYIYFELDEKMKSINEKNSQNEEVKKLLTTFINEFLNEVKDENIRLQKKVNVTTKFGEEKFSKIELSFNDDEIKDLILKMIKIYLDNDYFKKIIKEELIVNGQIKNDEEFNKMIEEIKKEIDNSFNEIDKVLNIKRLNEEYFIDDKDYIRGNKFELELDLNVDEENIKANVILEGKTEIWNINESLNIEIPKINKEENINILDLMNQQVNIFGF